MKTQALEVSPGARALRLVLLVLLGTALLLALARSAGARDAVPMKKYVSNRANFLLYAPAGWTVKEDSNALSWSVAVQDPQGGAGTLLVHGRSPVGDDVRRLSGALLEDLRRAPDARFDETRVSRDGQRLHARGTFTGDGGRRMEFRSWTAVRGGDFQYVRVLAPEGQYESQKDVLLSPLANLVAVPGSFGEVEAPPLPLVTYTLPQGAGTCLVPQGWRVTPYGGHYMVATDPQQRYGFFIGHDDVVTPRSGIRTQYVPTSDWLPPHQALALVLQHKRLASNIRIEQVNVNRELTQGASLLYPNGRVLVEEFTWTADGGGRRVKGFTIGLSAIGGAWLNWGFLAMTVTAPVEEFGALAATFAKMMASYRVDDRYAAAYVEAGRRRVQEMTAKTIQMIQRNRVEIQQMMNDAYRERQISQDYIDYIRTRYIRGESDWISAREGGTIYRSDRWGLENLTSGGRVDGQPVNYFNFRGGAGGYGDLVEINSRELWQQAYGQ